jgi:hypothetical protein
MDEKELVEAMVPSIHVVGKESDCQKMDMK